MGRAKHCSEEEKRLILQFRDQGKTFKFIAQALHRSECVIARVLIERNLPENKQKEGDVQKKQQIYLTNESLGKCLKIRFRHLRRLKPI